MKTPRSFRSCALVAWAGLALGACAMATTPRYPDVVVREAAPPPDVVQGPPQEYWYVVNTVVVDDDSRVDATGSHGFDLDGLFTVGLHGAQSPGCGKPDYFSVLDPDQNCTAVDENERCTGTLDAGVSYDPLARAQVGGQGGVDNQLPSLMLALSTLVEGYDRGALSASVRQSRRVWLVRVSDVNNAVQDPSVVLRFYVGYPTFTTGCDEVAAGRRYRVAASSLTSASLDDARVVFTGSIEDGRLRARQQGTFPLSLPAIAPGGIFGGLVVPLDLRDPQLRVNLVGSGPGQAGVAGNLGGFASGQAIRDAMHSAPPLAPYAALMDRAVAGVVDGPAPVCSTYFNGALAQVGELSVGLGFTLVAAEVDTSAPAAAQSPGTCGYAP